MPSVFTSALKHIADSSHSVQTSQYPAIDGLVAVLTVKITSRPKTCVNVNVDFHVHSLLALNKRCG
jgi:hypothetical protein